MGGTLALLRSTLVNTGKLSKNAAKAPFCDKEGVKVEDEMKFSKYFKEKESTYTIYIISSKRETDMNGAVVSFRDRGVNLENTRKVEYTTAQAQALASQYSYGSWQATAGTQSVHAADMTEKQWEIVMRNNDILCGQHPVMGKPASTDPVDGKPKKVTPQFIGLEKSRYPAFVLKPRKLPEYDITFVPSQNDLNIMKALKLENIDPVFRIPRFRIHDISTVELLETSSAAATSMASSGFDEKSIDDAVGGSFFGVSAAVNGGVSTSDENKDATSSFTNEKYMHISYNFPRVELILDEDNIELSEGCAADLEELRNRPTVSLLDRFYKRYGTCFASEVYLGGRLFSIEKSDAISGATTSEKTSVLRAAASASVSGWGFKAEVNASYRKDETSNQTMSHSMSWSANGGDTTLCNNPPAWCSTVLSFHNWRVMKQPRLVPLIYHISKLPGYDWVPEMIRFTVDQARSVYFRLKVQYSELYYGLDQPSNVDNWKKRAIKYGRMEPGSKEQISVLSKVKKGFNHIVFHVLEDSKKIQTGVEYDVRIYDAKDGQPYGLLLGKASEHFDDKDLLYGSKEKESNLRIMFKSALPVDRGTSRPVTPIPESSTVKFEFSLIGTNITADKPVGVYKGRKDDKFSEAIIDYCTEEDVMFKSTDRELKEAEILARMIHEEDQKREEAAEFKKRFGVMPADEDDFIQVMQPKREADERSRQAQIKLEEESEDNAEEESKRQSWVAEEYEKAVVLWRESGVKKVIQYLDRYPTNRTPEWYEKRKENRKKAFLEMVGEFIDFTVHEYPAGRPSLARLEEDYQKLMEVRIMRFMKWHVSGVSFELLSESETQKYNLYIWANWKSEEQEVMKYVLFSRYGRKGALNPHADKVKGLLNDDTDMRRIQQKYRLGEYK
ncbi:hypothetical protein ACMFMG_002864 [Clarireedia jacksonii]